MVGFDHTTVRSKSFGGGEIRIGLVAAGIVLVEAEVPDLSGSAAKWILLQLDDLLCPSTSIFFDLSQTSNYEAEARDVITSWLRDEHKRIAQFGVYTKSSFVRMGIGVVRIALRRILEIDAYKTRAEIDQAISMLADAVGTDHAAGS